MPSEQPREGTRVNPDGTEPPDYYVGCTPEPDDWRNDEEAQALIDAIKGEPASEQPTREGDDLTARGEWDRAERIAQDFHETYERLAPNHAYRTRPESAVPWSEVPPANKALMIATVQEVLARASTHPEQSARVERIIAICRNPAAPFYWDADRIGEPCPGCACWSDDINPPNHQHEFYVQVEPASTPEPPEDDRA